jgi:NAD+ diphosphatase
MERVADFEPAAALVQEATATAWCFAFAEGQLLLPEGHDTLAPGPLPDADARHYLGLLCGLDAWALRLDAAPPGWSAVPLRSAMMSLPAAQADVVARAAQVVEWDRTHRFCSVCGTPTQPLAHERARACPSCGHLSYPRVTPAMMVLIWRPGEVLLARSPRFAAGVYSALAGFVEAGETVEQCVAREAAEEVGVRVGDLRFYGSQSWPFPHSLMLAFTARWTGGDIVPQPGEIENAGWYRLDALPAIPPRFSISGHLIRDTVAALQAGREPLP